MLRECFGVSERRACKTTGQPRSTQRREPRPDEEERRLTRRIHELVLEWPRRGYKFITEQLRAEGWRVNRKRVYRIWRSEGLRVARRAVRKRRLGGPDGGVSRRRATRPNEVWAWDFFHDRLEDGRPVKWLSLIDEFTRECLLLHPARSITSAKAKELLMKTIEERGCAPAGLRSDNGPEFIARGLREFCETENVETLYIEPGSPWENGFAESFHARARDEFISLELFRSILEAKVMADDWRWKWNRRRLHGSLGYLTPAQFSANFKMPNETVEGKAAPAQTKPPPFRSMEETMAIPRIRILS